MNWGRPLLRTGRAASFYARAQYGRSISEEDMLLLAEEKGRIVGALRLAMEHGIRVLRGMRIERHHQRKGIGTTLLLKAAEAVSAEVCYCIPHRRLTSFYEVAGFTEIEPAAAPLFLRQRLAKYRSELGVDVILMRRLPQQPPQPNLGSVNRSGT